MEGVVRWSGAAVCDSQVAIGDAGTVASRERLERKQVSEESEDVEDPNHNKPHLGERFNMLQGKFKIRISHSIALKKPDL